MGRHSLKYANPRLALPFCHTTELQAGQGMTSLIQILILGKAYAPEVWGSHYMALILSFLVTGTWFAC